jgi:hypothetical protein
MPWESNGFQTVARHLLKIHFTDTHVRGAIQEDAL